MQATSNRSVPFVLLFAARPRNAEVLARALAKGRIGHETCGSVNAFRDRLNRSGGEAGAVVVTERGLALDARKALLAYQDAEPVWSELPIVLLSRRDRAPARQRALRNVILLRQPTTVRHFRSVVQLALETRAHQFAVQDLLLQLEEQRDWLEQALQHQQRAVEADRSERGELARKLAHTRRRLNRRREEDRHMLARELHDTVIQRLLYLSMRLSSAEAKARATGMTSLVTTIEEARGDAHAAVKDLRRLIRELRPAGLEMGFEAALQPTVSRLASTTRVILEADGVEELPRDVVLCMYRVTQEALRNIERHADASRVRVAVRRYGDEAHLLIADDGGGFDPPQPLERLAETEHFGLIGVEEFIAGIGGDLKIRSAKGSGTCLRARLPIEGDVVG